MNTLLDREAERKEQQTNSDSLTNNENSENENEDNIDNCVGSDAVQVTEEQNGTTNKINVQNNDQKKKSKICYHFKNNQCKFGGKGRECPFAHPKLCNRFKMNGRDPVRGCKHGDKCKYLHPPICYGSEKKRECLNLECKRLHLKGTRRYTPKMPTDEQQNTNYPPPITGAAIPSPNNQTQSESTNPYKQSPENWVNQPTYSATPAPQREVTWTNQPTQQHLHHKERLRGPTNKHANQPTQQHLHHKERLRGPTNKHANQPTQQHLHHKERLRGPTNKHANQPTQQHLHHKERLRV
ncbi:hypothetical protein Pcinc_036058 [Petrolisthes cinctipes]|uniref:C3H1-type domain-containing protein n=1 Tax=Petrolisthes cinctipes TaxID=88211 RepID=A0AAE1BYH0_PETCI|nr:hypothetical protein Pcinc_036058 [Petrolisthes cinctipes]